MCHWRFLTISQPFTTMFESSSQSTERANFLNYPTGSGINNVTTFNHTPADTSSEFQRAAGGCLNFDLFDFCDCHDGRSKPTK